ncbi:MAG: hypothetical protein SNH27_12620 [Rikenellaceae bacterium]
MKKNKIAFLASSTISSRVGRLGNGVASTRCGDEQISVEDKKRMYASYFSKHVTPQ